MRSLVFWKFARPRIWNGLSLRSRSTTRRLHWVLPALCLFAAACTEADRTGPTSTGPSGPDPVTLGVADGIWTVESDAHEPRSVVFLDSGDAYFGTAEGTVQKFDGDHLVVSAMLGVELTDFWAAGPDDIYAIGEAPNFRKWLYHFDGSDWSRVRGVDHEAFTVHGSSSSHVVVGGPGVVSIFDGNKWSSSKIPADAARAVYTAGNDFVIAAGPRGEMFHLVEGEWKQRTTASFWKVQTNISRFVGRGTEVYAATSYRVRGYFAGGEWQLLEDPGPTDGRYSGFQLTRVGDECVVLFENDLYTIENGTWEEVNVGLPDDVELVWGSSLDELHALQADSPSHRLLRRDGGMWTSLVARHSLAYKSVCTAGDGYLAVGAWGIEFDSRRSRPNRARRQRSDLFLTAVTGWEDGSSIAMSSEGGALSKQGDDWVALPVQPHGDPRVESIWGTSSSSFYAVSWPGELWRYRDGSWSRLFNLPRRTMQGVWGYGDDFAVAVGDYHQILLYDGADWDPVDLVNGTAASGGFRGADVWGVDAANCWAVMGTDLVRYVDGEFRAELAFPDVDLHAICGSSSDDILLIGYDKSGLPGDLDVFHFDGETWGEVPVALPKVSISDAVATGKGRFILVGEAGTVLRLDIQ